MRKPRSSGLGNDFTSRDPTPVRKPRNSGLDIKITSRNVKMQQKPRNSGLDVGSETRNPKLGSLWEKSKRKVCGQWKTAKKHNNLKAFGLPSPLQNPNSRTARSSEKRKPTGSSGRLCRWAGQWGRQFRGTNVQNPQTRETSKIARVGLCRRLSDATGAENPRGTRKPRKSTNLRGMGVGLAPLPSKATRHAKP